MGRRVLMILIAVVLAVFGGVLLWTWLTTPQIPAELQKQDKDLAAVAAQLNDTRANVPNLIQTTEKTLIFIHGERLKFQGVQGTVRDNTFNTISYAYQVAENDLLASDQMLHNLTIPEASEDSALSLLQENARLYRDNGLFGTHKAAIGSNSERIKNLNLVSERFLSDLDKLIFTQEENSLTLMRGVHNLEVLQEKDDETIQEIELQNKLLEVSGVAIENERKYHQLLSVILKRLEVAAKMQDGLLSTLD